VSSILPLDGPSRRHPLSRRLLVSGLASGEGRMQGPGAPSILVATIVQVDTACFAQGFALNNHLHGKLPRHGNRHLHSAWALGLGQNFLLAPLRATSGSG